ncbi:MAG: 3'-5' exonuclease domain-containing protein 2 [Verrucomicrobia bacterium]|nr:3'-5' exonuclease domain-containing protein 2 [Verrucomicrobiota bacterium]
MIQPENQPSGTDHRSIYRKMHRDEIQQLALASFTGEIHFIRKHDEVICAAKDLSRECLLGFDTETRPTFRKGECHPPALLQLCGSTAVYIFRLHDVGLPAELSSLLSNPAIVKAGVSVRQDISELKAITPFDANGFIDLGTVAREKGLHHHGLRGLAALLLNCRISKGAQLTNWSRADLPEHALRYAATDAWIGRRLYEAVNKLEDVAN